MIGVYGAAIIQKITELHPSAWLIRPRKMNGWNLKITQLKRKIIFQTAIFGVQKPLIFQGVDFW